MFHHNVSLYAAMLHRKKIKHYYFNHQHQALLSQHHQHEYNKKMSVYKRHKLTLLFNEALKRRRWMVPKYSGPNWLMVVLFSNFQHFTWFLNVFEVKFHVN
jgi:hypothetical protein